jgi:hypothetical protein
VKSGKGNLVAKSGDNPWLIANNPPLSRNNGGLLCAGSSFG